MAPKNLDPTYRPPPSIPTPRRPRPHSPTSKTSKQSSTKRALSADSNTRARKATKFNHSQGPSPPYSERERISSEAWKFEKPPDAEFPRTGSQEKRQRALDALKRLQGPVKEGEGEGDGGGEGMEGERVRVENLSVLLDAVEIPSTKSVNGRLEGKYRAGNTIRQNEKVHERQSPSKPRTPHDLDLSYPFPLHRSSYDPHPTEDRSDEWFISQFKELKDQILNFAENYFGFTEVEEETKVSSTWVDSEVGDEFIAWASQVCEPGNEGDWETMLEDKELVWMVAGILSQVVKKYVFDESLFGASEVEKEHLGSLERAMLTREGFERTHHRSQVARALLGHYPVTSNFNQDLATLTAETHLLFLPLSRYLRSLEASPTTVIPHAEDQYQDLHNLLSHAAYLSICVRLSPTIFFWVDERPGEHYDQDMHTNIDIEGWTWSKKSIMKEYARAQVEWRKRKEVAEKELRAHLNAGTLTSREGVRARKELEEVKTSYPVEPGREYQAQCKIAVFPSIKRFKAGSAKEAQKDAETNGGIPLREKRGCREREICKAEIVCYYGKINKSTDDQHLSLQDWVDVQRQEKEERDENLMWKAGKLVVKAAVTAVGAVGAGVVVASALPMVGVKVPDIGLQDIDLTFLGVPELLSWGAETAGGLWE